MQLHNPLRYRQAEAEAAAVARAVRTVEALKNLRQVLIGDTYTVVRNRDVRAIVPGLGVEPNVPAPPSILYGVANKINQELGHQALIGQNEHPVGCAVVQANLFF